MSHTAQIVLLMGAMVAFGMVAIYHITQAAKAEWLLGIEKRRTAILADAIDFEINALIKMRSRWNNALLEADIDNGIKLLKEALRSTSDSQ